TPAVEAVFASPVGSMVYDNIQALMRRLFSALQQPTEWLNIPAGGIALDVGCGPGTVTASLARAAGPGGLALGLDLSQAALAEMARVLRAGGRLAVMVPTAGWAAQFWRMLPNIGAHIFGEDDIGDILE